MTTPADALDAYVDLSLYDVDVDALVERALARVADVFPDWTPREGHVEVVLLEAFAVEVQELAYAINRVPSAVTETLLRLFGLEPDAGVAPQALVTFTVQPQPGTSTIPAGTSVALVLAGGLEPIIFRTDVDVLVAAGVSSVTAAATGTRATSEANSTTNGTAAVLLDPVGIVDRVTLGISGAGSDPEDGPAFLDRAVVRFRRLVATLVRPEHYTAAAEELPEVARATTISLYDPAQVPPTGRVGHVTTAVLGVGGAPIAAATLARLEATLEEQGHAGLDVHVVNATPTAVPITATLTRFPGYLPEEVKANAEQALRDYLNPETRPFGATVHRNELIALLDRVEGVDLVTLTAPAADVQLTGIAPLATAGTLTITVPS